MKNIFVFTDADLDGIGSLLSLAWAINEDPETLKFKVSTVSNIRKDFLQWLETNKTTDFDTLYFIDLDVSSCQDILDLSNAVIIDHHKSHVAVKENYKNAKVTIVETTSTARLIYATYKPAITKEQKYFIALVDDYDCYALKLPESYNLNALYFSTHKSLEKSKAQKFLSRYKAGWDGFTKLESGIVDEFIKKRDKVIKNLVIYEATLSLQGKPVRIVGSTADSCINDVADYLIKDLAGDVVFIVIPSGQGHVSWRKNRACHVDLSVLCTLLCNGGGHEYAAGGKITEKFLEFTKALKPREVK